MLNSSQLTQLKTVLKTASEMAMSFYRQDVKIERKSDNTPVTEADLAVSHYLENALPKILDIPVLSEESEKSTDFLNWQRYWLIDPIDGTRGFITHDDEFCICIAIIDKHLPVFGAICAPVSGELWFANSGDGVHKDNVYQTDSTPTLLPKPAPLDKDEPLTVVTKSLHYRPILSNFTDVTLAEFKRIPRGSALKFMRLTEGKAQLHFKFGKTGEWDTAAAHAILAEHGGGIINLAGEPLRYGTKKSLTNPKFIAYLNVSPQLLEKFIITAKAQGII